MSTAPHNKKRATSSSDIKMSSEMANCTQVNWDMPPVMGDNEPHWIVDEDIPIDASMVDE